jgi:hypothetical protein
MCVCHSLVKRHEPGAEVEVLPVPAAGCPPGRT